MTAFDLFIGVDWSGAKDEYQPGIQVAEFKCEDAAPKIVPPRDNKTNWSRQAVLDHLQERAKEHRVLAGIDFAFAYPFGKGGYFPDSGCSLKDAPSLWKMIDKINANKDHLYGGGIWHHPKFRPYYNTPTVDGILGESGEKYDSRLFRRTEETVKSVHGITPSPAFNCVGPKAVGTGTLAGMRLLNRLAEEGKASIWPLLPQPDARLTVVEIYPSLYFSMAKVKAQCSDANAPPKNKYEAVALISAAALRVLASDGFTEPGALNDDAKREGWIFGAGWNKEKSKKC